MLTRCPHARLSTPEPERDGTDGTDGRTRRWGVGSIVYWCQVVLVFMQIGMIPRTTMSMIDSDPAAPQGQLSLTRCYLGGRMISG